MKTKASKYVRVEHVKIYEIEFKDFQFFKNFFETFITQDLIEGEKNEQIKSIIEEKLPWEYKRDWVIVFGRDLAYNMQAKKKSLLVFKLGKIAFFVYQGKYLDMPMADPVEYLDDFTFDTNKLEDFKLNRVNIIEEKASKSEDFGKTIQTWIAKFCMKYESKMYEDYNEFEKLFIRKLKLELMLSAKEGFWNIFIGPRVNYVTENVKMEQELTISLDLTGGRLNKGKKNIVMFQKKGEPEAYMKFFVSKKKEMVGFVGMLMLFLIMVTCRNYDYEAMAGKTETGYIELIDFHYRKGDGFHDLVCLNQQMSLLFAGAIFFLYIGTKIFGAVQKKRKYRLKFH